MTEAETFLSKFDFNDKFASVEDCLIKQGVSIEIPNQFYDYGEATFSDGSSVTFNNKNECECFKGESNEF